MQADDGGAILIPHPHAWRGVAFQFPTPPPPLDPAALQTPFSVLSLSTSLMNAQEGRLRALASVQFPEGGWCPKHQAMLRLLPEYCCTMLLREVPGG